MQNQKIVFSLTIDDLQKESIQLIGRRLNSEELRSAKKGIESGLSCVIDTTLKNAILEAIEQKS